MPSSRSTRAATLLMVIIVALASCTSSSTTEAEIEPESESEPSGSSSTTAVSPATTTSTTTAAAPPDGERYLVWGRDVLGRWENGRFQEIDSDGSTIAVQATYFESGETASFEVELHHCHAEPARHEGELGVTGLDWDPSREITEIAPSPEHVDTVAAILADEGLPDAEVIITQTIRLDLEDDGVDEVLIVASNAQGTSSGNAGSPPGAYSISVLRRVEQGSVQIEPLYVAAATEADGPTEGYEDLFPSVVAEYVDDTAFATAADVDGDGVAELVMDVGAWEFSGVQVWGYVDGVMTRWLEAGCGA